MIAPRAGGLLLSSIALTAACFAQAPAFEAATIKPAAHGQAIPRIQGGPGTPDPRRITYAYLTLSNLISIAYDVGGDQVSGQPWLRAERYDVQATLPAGATKEQARVMLQNLLAERFQLSFHRIKKESEAYDLVQAKSEPKLKPASAVDGGAFAAAPLHQVTQTITNGIA